MRIYEVDNMSRVSIEFQYKSTSVPSRMPLMLLTIFSGHSVIDSEKRSSVWLVNKMTAPPRRLRNVCEDDLDKFLND